LREDGAPPDAWLDEEVVDTSAATALALVALADGSFLAAAREPSGQAWLRRRSPAGLWGARKALGEARDPALVVDPLAGEIHLFHRLEAQGHRVVLRRRARAADLEFGPAALAMGWPRVSLDPPLVAAALPESAGDLVAAALGDDGLGCFARLELERTSDRQAPISFQHAPTPGATSVPRRPEISFRLTDDRASIRLLLDGQAASPSVRGVRGNYLVRFTPPQELAGPELRVRIQARDLASPPQVMAPFEYTLELVPSAGTRFRRGDANTDGGLEIGDAVRTLLGVFTASHALG
jgi:hypothetical protein